MKNLIVILILGVCLFGCENDDDSISPITEDNSFSCYVNGELFLPKDRIGFPTQADGINVGVYPETNDWVLGFTNHDTNRSVTLFLKNVTTTGEYPVFAIEGDFGAPFELTKVHYSDTHLDDLFVSTDDTGNINVTELTLNSKIVLTFDKLTLDGLALDGTVNNDTLILTDGMLNINLDTLE